MNYKLILLSLLLGIGSKLPAQLTFTAYPYFAYSSETRFMVGAFTFARYDYTTPFSKPDPHRLSLLGNSIYSQNKQFMLALIPRYEIGNISLDSSMEFSSWPDTFFGTGNSTSADLSESFSSINYATETSARYRFGRSLIASVQMDLGWHELRDVQSAGMLDSAEISGKNDALHSGIGASLSFDSSDGSYYPTRGVRFEIKRIHYDEALGSDHSWQKNSYDFRGYLPVGANTVLAAQSDLEINQGDVPFYRFPELGKRLRAYDSKRFIDRVRISQRLESRIFPFSEGFLDRLGFVLFAEAGQVASVFEDIDVKDWHWSLGSGLRFSILPAERLNLRADFGFGKDSFNFIINAREAF